MLVRVQNCVYSVCKNARTRMSSGYVSSYRLARSPPLMQIQFSLNTPLSLLTNIFGRSVGVICLQPQVLRLSPWGFASAFQFPAVAQWLRCWATNRKVAGSIPDGVIGIFHWHNPPDRTMALGSTQPLTNEYQEDFLRVNAAGAYGWQPYHLPVPLS